MMTVCNLVCAAAVVATFGVLVMCCAFWFGVAVGRREGARALGRCWAVVPDDGADGVSVKFKQKGDAR